MVSSAASIIVSNDDPLKKTKKKSSGRKKIDIKKIENTNSLQVAFSKRRTGLFKKASELCVMTGAQVAIFVNSPAGRMYVFGSPDDVDALIQRSHLQDINNNNNVLSSLPLLPQNNNHYFNQSYDQEVLNEFDAGNTQSEMIESAGGIDPEKTWTGSSNQSGSNDVIAVEELLSESDAGNTPPNEMIVSSVGNINHGLEGVDEFFRGFDPEKEWNQMITSTACSNDVLGVEDLLCESDDAGQKIESAGSNDDEFFRGFDAEKAWNKMITSTGSNQSGSNDVLEVQELLRNTPIVSSGDGLGWFD